MIQLTLSSYEIIKKFRHCRNLTSSKDILRTLLTWLRFHDQF